MYGAVGHRYQLATISSNAQRKFPSPCTLAATALTAPKREKSPDMASNPSERRILYWISSYGENKPDPVTPRKPRDQPNITPRRYRSLEGGAWPSKAGNALDGLSSSSSSSSTSVRTQLADENKFKLDGNGHGNEKVVKTRRSVSTGRDICDRRMHSLEINAIVTPRRLRMDLATTTQRVASAEQGKKTLNNCSSKTLKEEQPIDVDETCTDKAQNEGDGAISVGKQLGERFENLDSSFVKQFIKATVKTAFTQKSKEEKECEKDQVKDATSAEKLRSRNANQDADNGRQTLMQHQNCDGNSELEVSHRRRCSKQSEDSKEKKRNTSPSLSNRVASLLTAPGRIYKKKYASLNKAEADKATDVAKICRSSSARALPSMAKSASNCDRSSPKVKRCSSLDRREECKVAEMGTIASVASTTSRSDKCRSKDSLEQTFTTFDRMTTMTEHNGSDTESSSSGSSQYSAGKSYSTPLPWLVASLNSSSDTTLYRRFSRLRVGRGGVDDGDGIRSSSTSPASFSRRLRHCCATNGAHFSSMSLATMSAAWEPTQRPPGRRDAGVVMEVCLLLNRWLQWRYVNAASSSALKAQITTALSTLYNACLDVFKLRASVARQQALLESVRRNDKLYLMLETLGVYLEEWGGVQREHASALNTVIQALEATVMRVPLVQGAKTDQRSVNDALCCASKTMKAVDGMLIHFLPNMVAIDNLLPELTKTVILEKACLEELYELLPHAITLEIEERSLRAWMVQMETENCTMVHANKSSSKTLPVH